MGRLYYPYLCPPGYAHAVPMYPQTFLCASSFSLPAAPGKFLQPNPRSCSTRKCLLITMIMLAFSRAHVERKDGRSQLTESYCVSLFPSPETFFALSVTSHRFELPVSTVNRQSAGDPSAIITKPAEMSFCCQLLQG